MTIKLFGDSITVGQVGPTVGHSYASLLQERLDTPLVMYAVNGSCAGDQAIAAQSLLTNPNDIDGLMIGINDSQRYFSTTQHSYYRGYITEILSRMSYSTRVSARSVNMIKAGTWVNTQPVWSQGCYSNVAGSTATTTVSGRSILIGTVFQDYMGNGVPGSAEVRVDGVLIGTYSSNGIGGSTAYTDFAPAAIRYSGFADGLHTVEVKIISGFIYLEYILGTDQEQGAKGFVMTPSRTYQPNDNGVAAGALATIVREVVAAFAEDGRSIYLVDVALKLNQTHVIADLIHLNNTGNLLIADAFVAALQATLPTPTFTLEYNYRDNNGNHYVGNLEEGEMYLLSNLTKIEI